MFLYMETKPETKKLERFTHCELDKLFHLDSDKHEEKIVAQIPHKAINPPKQIHKDDESNDSDSDDESVKSSDTIHKTPIIDMAMGDIMDEYKNGIIDRGTMILMLQILNSNIELEKLKYKNN